MDEATVQAAIGAAAARGGLSESEVAAFVPTSRNQDAGTPFWYVDGDVLGYRADERGQPVFDRRTESLDELLEWVFRDVTWALAQDHELHHRRAGEDSRRQMFATWVDLATRLNPVWGRHVAEYVDQVLRTAPYVDRG